MAPRRVKVLVRAFLSAILVCLPLVAADPVTDPEAKRLLQGMEDRYNHVKTLQVDFSESYSVQGHSGKPESGVLFLRKPGKMRWDYSTPQGKLFVSDGKDVFLYTPAGNKVEKMKLKESDDMRAPLAFLLGKLEFEKDFEQFRAKKLPDGNTAFTAKPKLERLPYSRVEFVVAPGFEIKKLDVHGHDESVLTFVFANEKLNPSLNDHLFKFQTPAGAAFADLSDEK